jgi:hypothetical protein
VRRLVKKKRWLADLVSTYGLDVLDWPGMPGKSYELAFALQLLADRVNTRRSFVVLDGVKGAMAPFIEPHFFKAMLERADEAEFYSGLHADRVKSKMRRGRRMQDLSLLGEAVE